MPPLPRLLRLLRPRPGTAWLGVALLLALTCLAVRPDWHTALCHHQEPTVPTDCSHAHDHEPESDLHAHEGCVVFAFAHGVVLGASALDLQPIASSARPLPFLPEALLLRAVAHRWPTPCGPPAV